MKSGLFKVLAVVFAILGIIGGIVNGNQALSGFSVLAMLTTWIETGLFVLIFAQKTIVIFVSFFEENKTKYRICLIISLFFTIYK